jgi:transcriptional regulator with XRE-family HTH domain
MTKPIEKGVARQLRAEHGWPIKKIANLLAVSPATVSGWVRGIEITPEQRERNLARAGRIRGDSWREINRRRRAGYQAEGRERARQMDPLHLAGCMLYWAEGSKSRNSLGLANSDLNMVKFFLRFLRESLGVTDECISMRLNVYLGNGLSLREIENHWIENLELSQSCLRKHSVNHFPTSSSGRKKDCLPYGVCTLRALRSTPLVQHIYGAIQEYTGLKQPRWLDGHY